MNTNKLYKIGRGTNGHAVVIGTLTIYFSYETAIGFKTAFSGGLFRSNVWGQTTGGHLKAAKFDAGYLTSEPRPAEDAEVFAECLSLAMRGKYKGPSSFDAITRKHARIRRAGERADKAAIARIEADAVPTTEGS